jgi:hypothetical protein
MREWNVAQAVHHGWSRNVLEHHIRTVVHVWLEAAPANFAVTLAAGESGLAQQIFEDPYVLDFLALEGDAKELQLSRPCSIGSSTRCASRGRGSCSWAESVLVTLGWCGFKSRLGFRPPASSPQ